MWTKFWDMHSGGSKKTKWDFIYIEAASEERAVFMFEQIFGQSPNDVACHCCGPNFSVDSSESLEQLTGFHRNCAWESGKYVEHVDLSRVEMYERYGEKAPKHVPLSEYLTWNTIKVLREGETLKDETLKGETLKEMKEWW